MSGLEVVFDAQGCTCEHSASHHDHGFGCVHPGCDCMAMWSWYLDDRETAAIDWFAP